MPGRLVSVDLFDELPCAGGVRLAGVPIADDQDPRLEERLDTGSGWLTRRFTMAIPATWAERAQLVPGSVLRTRWERGDPPSPVILEFRVEDLTDGYPGRHIEVIAHGIEWDLQSRDQAVRDTSGSVNFAGAVEGAPAGLLAEYVVAYGPSYVSLGTVTPVDPIEVTFAAGDMPWDAGSKIQQAVSDQTFLDAQGQFFLALERDGDTGYLLTCTDVGASAPLVDVRAGKNLLELVRRRSRTRQVNRVLLLDSTGEPLPGGNLWHVYTGPSPTTFLVVDIAHERPGAGPIAVEAGQWNGYVWVDAAGNEHTILDAQLFATGSFEVVELTVADTTGIAFADLGRIMHPGKVPIVEVDAPVRQAANGIIARKASAALDRYTNIFRNADMFSAPGGLPIWWTTFGTGTIVGDTTVYRTGGRSIKLTTTTTPFNPGAYAERAYRSLAAEDVVLSIWYRLDSSALVSIQIRAWVDGVEVSGSPFNAATPGTEADVWHRKDFVTSVAAGLHTYKIQGTNSVAQTGRTVWIDAAQCTPGTNTPVRFRVGSSPAKAIQLANRLIATLGDGDVSYSGRVADLYRALPQRFPYERLELGGQLQAREPGLDLTVTPRLSRVVWNGRNPLDTETDWTSEVPDFVRLVGGS